MPVLRAVIDGMVRGVYRLGYRGAVAWWYLRRPRHDGAVVAVWLDGEILMVRHSYRRALGWPGGGIGLGERPVDAARRELREEVGLAIESKALVLAAEIDERWEFRRDRIRIFELELGMPPPFRLDRREVVDAVFMTPAAALAEEIAPFIRTYLEARTAGAKAGKGD